MIRLSEPRRPATGAVLPPAFVRYGKNIAVKARVFTQKVSTNAWTVSSPITLLSCRASMSLQPELAAVACSAPAMSPLVRHYPLVGRMEWCCSQVPGVCLRRLRLLRG